VIFEALTHSAHEARPIEDPIGVDALTTAHAPDYVWFLQQAYAHWVAEGRSEEGVAPDAFPSRMGGTPPQSVRGLAGWYAFDPETPIGPQTFASAQGAAQAALAAAHAVSAGEPFAYALCRPPGHHAGPAYCGGYCYFNNAALAAKALGPGTAVLDVDCHHANGTQDLFYASAEHFTASLHGDPDVTYPFYWGRAGEIGSGAGEGANLNIPLSPGTSDAAYLTALERGCEAIAAAGARRLVVSFGADAIASDPLGSLGLSEAVFGPMAKVIADLRLPTCVVQEGGYDYDALGRCVVAFLDGLEAA
jgi:acetoin utilization deacetylase AcuC-like enzyme